MNPSLKRMLVSLLVIAALLSGCSLSDLLPASTPTEDTTFTEPNSEALDPPTLEFVSGPTKVCLPS